MTPIGDHSKNIAFRGAEFAPDGTLWVTSDENSDVQRLGRIDPASGYCEGCFRSIPEITDWSRADDTRKREILAAVARRKAAGQAGGQARGRQVADA